MKRITVMTLRKPKIALIVSDMMISSNLYNNFLSLSTLRSLKKRRKRTILISLSSWGALDTLDLEVLTLTVVFSSSF